MVQVLDFLMCLINQGIKILTMTQTLSFRVLLEMTSTAAQEKVIPLNTEVSAAQVVLSLKLKMNGNKKILRRDMKKEKTGS